jgi:hypothetical protein
MPQKGYFLKNFFGVFVRVRVNLADSIIGLTILGKPGFCPAKSA